MRSSKPRPRRRPYLPHTADAPSAPDPDAPEHTLVAALTDENGSCHLDIGIDGPRRANQPRLHVRDTSITIPGTYPVTLAAACIGRMVAEAIRLPKPFARGLGHRHIIAASTIKTAGFQALELTVKPDRVRIGDAIDAVHHRR